MEISSHNPKYLPAPHPPKDRVADGQREVPRQPHGPSPAPSAKAPVRFYKPYKTKGLAQVGHFIDVVV